MIEHFKAPWPGSGTTPAQLAFYRNTLGCNGAGPASFRTPPTVAAGCVAEIIRRHTNDKDTREQVDDGCAAHRDYGNANNITRIVMCNDESQVGPAVTRAEIAHLKTIDPALQAAYVNPWTSKPSFGWVTPPMVAGYDCVIWYLNCTSPTRGPEWAAWAMARAFATGLPIIAGVQPCDGNHIPVDPARFQGASLLTRWADARVMWAADDLLTAFSGAQGAFYAIRAGLIAEYFNALTYAPIGKTVIIPRSTDYRKEVAACKAAIAKGATPVFA